MEKILITLHRSLKQTAYNSHEEPKSCKLMLVSMVEEVSKSKKKDRLKIPGIEEDRQMGPRMKDKRGRKKG